MKVGIKERSSGPRHSRLKNNAAIFEARGNPWDDSAVQRKVLIPRPSAHSERIEAALARHGMTSRYAAETRLRYATESQPELDAFTKAGKAPVHVEPASAFKAVSKADRQSRAQDRVDSMLRAMAAKNKGRR